MPNLLHLHFETNSSGTIYIKNRIAKVNNIRLKSYRIEFTDNTSAQANDIIFVNLNFLNSSGLNSSFKDINGIPLYVSGDAVTIKDCDYTISLQSNIETFIDYVLIGDDLSNFTSLDLIFEYDIGGL